MTSTVTILHRTEAYYSNYGGNPPCFAEVGEVVRVATRKVPAVFGPRPYFMRCEFEKYGKTWSIALWPGDYR